MDGASRGLAFWGWTLAQNQTSLDWVFSVDKQEKVHVF